jgi:adenylate kinase family enzyme
VVGTTGSGKTSTARRIAEVIEAPHFELDAIHWGPDWTPEPADVFRERVGAALQRDAWVCDGNYSRVRDIVWGRADTIVWLDYGLAVVLWQLVMRTVRRAVRQTELWHGNRESLRRSFLSRDSILLWALKTFGPRRRRYARLLSQPEYAHIAVVHLRSPSETRAWLRGLTEEA